MLHSIGAVILGFVVMAVIVMVGTMALAAALLPGGLAAVRNAGHPTAPTITPPYLAMNLTLSLLAALVGGWVTARLARNAPGAHVAALCALILVMGVVSAFAPGNDRQPTWYKLLIPLVGAAGAAASLLLVAA